MSKDRVRLLIADDEERVCRLIHMLGDWEGLQVEVVGMVSNGLEALRVIRTSGVDILVTDIRMPGCGGLELIEKVRENNPAIRILIISGYANFEYAKFALTYGVKDYLLKPISQSALNESLDRICREIREERRQSEQLESMLSEREEDSSRLKERLLIDLLADPDLVLQEEWLETRYHLRPSDRGYMTFVYRMDREEELEAKSRHLVWREFSALAAERFAPVCLDSSFCFQGYYFYGLVSMAEGDAERVRRILRDILNVSEARRGLYGGIQMTCGAGLPVRDCREIAGSLALARRAVEEGLLHGSGQLYLPIEQGPGLTEKHLLDRFSKILVRAMETIGEQEIQDFLEMAEQEICTCSQVRGWEVRSFIEKAADLFLIHGGNTRQAEAAEVFRARCSRSGRAGDLFDALRTLVGDQMKQLLDMRDEEANRPIRLAKQYIRSHYSEPISLEDVGREVGLATAYLSTLFKKESDVGFAKYLVSIRVDAAKELLRESPLPVKEVCRRVGYHDVKHFTHIFEKETGVKPTTYRKLYG